MISSPAQTLVVDHRAVPRVKADTEVGQPGLDALPNPGVIADQRSLAGKVKVDSLVRPGSCHVGGAADRAAPPPTTITDLAADTRSCAARRSALISAADCILARRQSDRQLGGDDQRSYPSANGVPSSRRRQTAERPVPVRSACPDDPHPIQSAESVEWDPVVTGPIVGPGQPDSEFLAADQCRFDRDPGDVGMTGEPNRGEDTYVPESRDDDAFAAHVAARAFTIGKL